MPHKIATFLVFCRELEFQHPDLYLNNRSTAIIIECGALVSGTNKAQRVACFDHTLNSEFSKELRHFIYKTIVITEF